MRRRIGVALHRLGLYHPSRSLSHDLRRQLPAGRRRTAQLRALYRSFLSPGDLVFDVGANIGDVAAVLAGVPVRVVAVEPQPAMAATIQRRVPAATVLAMAVGREAGTIDLWIDDLAPSIATASTAWRTASRYRDRGYGRSIAVPVTTLDALIHTFGVPRYCKIDVEGFETEVLAGLSAQLPMVSFEYTPELAVNAVACVNRLSMLGATSFSLLLPDGDAWAIPWLPAGDLFPAIDRTYPGQTGDIFARID